MTDWFDRHSATFEEILQLRLGVAQRDNRRMFDLLSQIAPLTLLSYRSGREHNGWVVPHDWQLARSEIRRDGKVVFDGAVHPLATIGNSRAFSGTVTKAELDKHVFYSKAQPDAYAFHCTNNYRPWATDWGFCVPYSDYKSWPDGNYEIALDAMFSEGVMLVGELDLPGASQETIVFNAHTCHPGQFEDGFSGVALILELLEYLRALPHRRYSYKAILAPEHLGTVFYLADLEPRKRAALKGVVFTEMIGLPGNLTLQKTFNGDHILDRLVAKAAQEAEPDARIGDFRTILGNDETVWEAPGIEIPCISLSRCSRSPYYYDEYHTSNDLVARSDMKRRGGALALLRATVDALEQDAVPVRSFEGLIALSNPKYDLYVERPEPTVAKDLSAHQLRLGELQDRIVRYFDGRFSIAELAEKFALPFPTMRDYVASFAAKGLVDLVPIAGIDWYAQDPANRPARC